MTTWAVALADYSDWARAGGQASGTVRIRRSYLTRLARHVGDDPWSADLGGLCAFLANRRWKANTRHAARGALASFYGWAVIAGHMTTDPTIRLPKAPVPPGVPRPTPAHVVRAALDRATPRDRLMILLAIHAGLRRSEIARVHSRDVADGYLYVLGKGAKMRRIPLSTELHRVLAAWPAGYAFPGMVDGHLSADRVGRILKDLLGDGWTAHTLRHRFATTGYAHERDLLAMQKLLGHAKPETTAIYTAAPDDALRRAVEAAAGSL